MEVAQQNGSFLPTLLVKLEQGILNNVALSEEEEQKKHLVVQNPGKFRWRWKEGDEALEKQES